MFIFKSVFELIFELIFEFVFELISKYIFEAEIYHWQQHPLNLLMFRG